MGAYALPRNVLGNQQLARSAVRAPCIVRFASSYATRSWRRFVCVRLELYMYVLQCGVDVVFSSRSPGTLSSFCWLLAVGCLLFGDSGFRVQVQVTLINRRSLEEVEVT